jgi:hypothetical protein
VIIVHKSKLVTLGILETDDSKYQYLATDYFSS